MRLSDRAIARLREAADLPDLSGTRYRLLDKLGQGGMGTVYSVEDTALQRRVALKVTDFPGSDGQLAARLLQEARVIASLEHPGMVPVHDAGALADGRVFYVMKLVQGRRLDDPQALPGSEGERLRIFQKICETVSFAHAHGIVHRDLKPSNIMIGPFGEVLVMDWGLAELLGGPDALGEDRDPARTSVGTPGFMAPESMGGGVGGPGSDIYALGVVLKLMMPQGEANPISRRLNSIIHKATHPDQEGRYVSVEALAGDIAQYIQGGRVLAHPESVVERGWRWVVRNRAWILLILAYLVARTLFIIWRKYF